MTDQYALEEYTGFTEEEVKELCVKYDMDFDETSSWYDGYMFGQFKHIYNPKSVASAYLEYNAEREEVFIPNKEIIKEFETAMGAGGWS